MSRTSRGPMLTWGPPHFERPSPSSVLAWLGQGQGQGLGSGKVSASGPRLGAQLHICERRRVVLRLLRPLRLLGLTLLGWVAGGGAWSEEEGSGGKWREVEGSGGKWRESGVSKRNSNENM